MPVCLKRDTNGSSSSGSISLSVGTLCVLIKLLIQLIIIHLHFVTPSDCTGNICLFSSVLCSIFFQLYLKPEVCTFSPCFFPGFCAIFFL